MKFFVALVIISIVFSCSSTKMHGPPRIIDLNYPRSSTAIYVDTFDFKPILYKDHRWHTSQFASTSVNYGFLLKLNTQTQKFISVKGFVSLDTSQCYFDQRAWIYLPKDAKELFRHEMFHYLLYIALVKEKTINLNKAKHVTVSNFHILDSSLRSKIDAEQNKYDLETGHDTITNIQRKWETEIIKRLVKVRAIKLVDDK